MAKYDEQFKQKVVKQYLAGGVGYKTLAREYGLHHRQVEQWVGHYRLHGLAGLRKKYSAYSAQFKLEVLERMWRDGLSQTQVRAIFGIREPGAISRWERQYHEGGLPALSPRPKGRPRKMPNSLPPRTHPPGIRTGCP